MVKNELKRFWARATVQMNPKIKLPAIYLIMVYQTLVVGITYTFFPESGSPAITEHDYVILSPLKYGLIMLAVSISVLLNWKSQYILAARLSAMWGFLGWLFGGIIYLQFGSYYILAILAVPGMFFYAYASIRFSYRSIKMGWSMNPLDSNNQ